MSEEVKIKISQPMFEVGELERFDNNIHSIVEEYSKLMFKEKDQILTQRIIMKQEKEIERLKKELKKHIKEGIEKDIRINNALEYINDGSVFDGSSMCSNDLRLLLSGIIVRSDKE